MKRVFLISAIGLLVIILGCQDKRAIEKQNKAIVLKWLNEVNQENFEQLFDDLWAKHIIVNISLLDEWKAELEKHGWTDEKFDKELTKKLERKKVKKAA